MFLYQLCHRLHLSSFLHVYFQLYLRLEKFLHKKKNHLIGDDEKVQLEGLFA